MNQGQYKRFIDWAFSAFDLWLCDMTKIQRQFFLKELNEHLIKRWDLDEQS